MTRKNKVSTMISEDGDHTLSLHGGEEWTGVLIKAIDLINGGSQTVRIYSSELEQFYFEAPYKIAPIIHKLIGEVDVLCGGPGKVRVIWGRRGLVVVEKMEQKRL